MSRSKNKILALKFFASCLALLSFFIAAKAQAASLYFNPTTGSYNVGDTIKVAVMVDTQNVPINSVESTINFPKDYLNITSVNRAGSIFTFWVQEPFFSNTTGEISFSGGLPTPGYNGNNGKVLEIYFSVKKAGLSALLFTSGAVRANDGLGTDVLQSKGKANFTTSLIKETVVPEVDSDSLTEVTPIATPVTPVVVTIDTATVITSPTNPDPKKWYNNPNPKFTWPVDDDVIAVKISYTKKLANPTVSYNTSISEKIINDVSDGSYYFNLQLRNKSGWGKISHFAFKVDTEAPSNISVIEIPRDDTTFPQVKFTLSASDKLSGMDHFEMQIDGEEAKVWTDDGTHNYQTPALEPGKHVLLTKAFDKAGNYVSTSNSFSIDPLKTPTITDYSREIPTSETLIVRGLTYPSSQVIVFLQKGKENAKSAIVQSNQNGEFIFTPDQSLDDDVYTLWVQALDSRGAKSLAGNKVTIVVTKSPLLKIGTWTVNVLSVIVPFAALLALMVLLSMYSWHKFLILRKRIQKEAREIEKEIHKAFDIIKDDMADQIKMLKKAKTERQLTSEEDKIIKRLKKNLNMAENIIQKDIEAIEKEVE